jgi:nicotinamidase-related amidase
MTTALVLIDLQQAIFRGRGGSRQAEADAALEAAGTKAAAVLAAARKSGLAVVHVQHDGPDGHRLAKGSAGWGLRAQTAPAAGEAVIHKTASDSFLGTTLKETLRRLGAERIVIAGCMSDFCVDTTCRSAVAHGFDVVLVADGHATVDNDVLRLEQIVAHHNTTLDGFDVGARAVAVRPAAEVIAGL